MTELHSYYIQYLPKSTQSMNPKLREVSKTVQKQLNIDLRLSKARKSGRLNNSSRNRQKKKKSCLQGCQKHQFELKPATYSSFLSKGITQPVTINLCRGNSTTIPIPSISQELRNEPHVPMFILKEETHKYQHYLDSHRHQFADAIKKANEVDDSEEEEEQKMLAPIPRTKNCQICRLKIETQHEYEKHLSSIDHRMALRNSLGQQYIVEETQLFQQQRRSESKAREKLGEVKEVWEALRETKKMIKLVLRRR